MLFDFREEIVKSNWNQEDNKKMKKNDADFVSCDEMKTSEQTKFNEYIKIYGQEKVDKCCDESGNRKREDFEKCLGGDND